MGMGKYILHGSQKIPTQKNPVFLYSYHLFSLTKNAL
jgi:hypothetical protein